MSDRDPPSGPGPAYDLQRSDGTSKPTKYNTSSSSTSNAGDVSLDYSSNLGDGDSESYLAIHTLAESSIVTGHVANYHTTHADATDTVHEMHLALLYLLSNPEEFKKALASHPARGATTLAQWNAEYDNESMTEAESIVTAADTNNYDTNTISTAGGGGSVNAATPLPFVVFADDAEVVLPQAHTASQLFGVERLEGIELEAAAGIPALSQLFLRWLALMPQGDHLNIIDPPGLTVMRIAGGRYRVTAVHRVVWTWMNEFAALTDPHRTSTQHSNDESINTLQVGDLVSMTIVDVFETDNQGKLLSYCPTFDNRAVIKTHATTESLRKSSHKLVNMLGQAQKSQTAAMILKNARGMAESVRQKVDEAVQTYNSPSRRGAGQDLELVPEESSSAGGGGGGGGGITSKLGQSVNLNVSAAQQVSGATGAYVGGDDTERHEI